MPSSRKKVIVRKFNREWLAGYLPSVDFAQQGVVELLNLAGKVEILALEGVKWLCFVQDFNSGEPENPERLLRKTFARKPQGSGVWVRCRLRDGETIEGIAANDLSLLHVEGLLLTPPDIQSNALRIFLPRVAITSFEAVGVLSVPVRRQGKPLPSEGLGQEELFATPD